MTTDITPVKAMQDSNTTQAVKIGCKINIELQSKVFNLKKVYIKHIWVN